LSRPALESAAIAFRSAASRHRSCRDTNTVTSHLADLAASERASIFDVLDHELAVRALQAPPPAAAGLIVGSVGYLGYECKADCGSPNAHSSDVPDALLLLIEEVYGAVDTTWVVYGPQKRFRGQVIAMHNPWLFTDTNYAERERPRVVSDS